MRTLAVQQCYLLLPVLVHRLLRERAAGWMVGEFLERAEAEMAVWREELRGRRERYLARRPSRLDRQYSSPCFDTEERWLRLVSESLDHLERYSATRDAESLREALATYDSSDKQFAQLIKLRKALPPGVEEELQRAA